MQNTIFTFSVSNNTQDQFPSGIEHVSTSHMPHLKKDKSEAEASETNALSNVSDDKAILMFLNENRNLVAITRDDCYRDNRLLGRYGLFPKFEQIRKDSVNCSETKHQALRGIASIYGLPCVSSGVFLYIEDREHFVKCVAEALLKAEILKNIYNPRTCFYRYWLKHYRPFFDPHNKLDLHKQVILAVGKTKMPCECINAHWFH